MDSYALWSSQSPDWVCGLQPHSVLSAACSGMSETFNCDYRLVSSAPCVIGFSSTVSGLIKQVGLKSIRHETEFDFTSSSLSDISSRVLTGPASEESMVALQICAWVYECICRSGSSSCCGKWRQYLYQSACYFLNSPISGSIDLVSS